MIDKVETQSHLFKIENEAIRIAIKEQASSSSVHSPNTNNHLNLPSAPALSASYSTTPSSLSSFATTPAAATSGTRDSDLRDLNLDLDLDLNLEFDQKLFDSIATVGYDERMDVSYLQLQPFSEHEVFGNTHRPIMNPFDQTIKKEETPIHLQNQVQLPNYTTLPLAHVNTNMAMDAAYENPEVALLAINFILAYVSSTCFLQTSLVI